MSLKVHTLNECAVMNVVRMNIPLEWVCCFGLE